MKNARKTNNFKLITFFIYKMKYIFIITFILFFAESIYSQTTTLDSISANSAFNVGEELRYEVKYGLIKGGEAKMRIDLFPVGDSYVYHVKAIATTTGMAAQFAKIYDIYESYIDISTGYPIKSVRNIRENKYTKYNETLFFREDKYIVSVNSGRHDVPYNTLDILSAFYYARRALFDKPISKGETIDITTFFEDDLYPLKIKFIGKDRIRTKFGKINCLKFIPVLEKNNPFKKEDDLQIWISDDGNYIPVKIQMRLPVGNAKASLIGFENLKNDFGKK